MILSFFIDFIVERFLLMLIYHLVHSFALFQMFMQEKSFFCNFIFREKIR